MISQVAAGKTEILLGSLDPTRDFTFVTDTANAFATLGNAPAADVIGRTFNSGSNQEISIQDLVLTIAESAAISGVAADAGAASPWRRRVRWPILRSTLGRWRGRRLSGPGRVAGLRLG